MSRIHKFVSYSSIMVRCRSRVMYRVQCSNGITFRHPWEKVYVSTLRRASSVPAINSLMEIISSIRNIVTLITPRSFNNKYSTRAWNRRRNHRENIERSCTGATSVFSFRILAFHFSRVIYHFRLKRFFLRLSEVKQGKTSSRTDEVSFAVKKSDRYAGIFEKKDNRVYSKVK